MDKINHRYNLQRRRLERWLNIQWKLNEFEGLINGYDGASSEEVRVMRAMHVKLYECRELASEQIKDVRANARSRM